MLVTVDHGAFRQSARGSWSLNTSEMAPCGYTINVTAVSRAIYNSSPSYTDATASAGFCLQVGD